MDEFEDALQQARKPSAELVDERPVSASFVPEDERREAISQPKETIKRQNDIGLVNPPAPIDLGDKLPSINAIKIGETASFPEMPNTAESPPYADTLSV